MFYVTTIQSVKNGFAIDTQGRNLSFIGYLNVKQGDNVYTDGTVIFGNVPPKGEPVIIDEQVSGIPVLGSTIPPRHNEVRGYFTQQGKFKKYKIKADGWLVNDKKYFAHDDGEQNIIDAEFSEDGKLYTVEKKNIQHAANDLDYHNGFYSKSSTPTFEAINFGRIAVYCDGDKQFFNADTLVGFAGSDYKYAEYYGLGGDYFHTPFYYFGPNAGISSYDDGFYPYFTDINPGYGIRLRMCQFFLRGQLDYRKFDDKIIRECSLIIHEDNDELQTIDIADLLRNFEQTAQAEVDLLPERESVKHLKSRAAVRNFKIFTNGDWELLLEAEVWASNTFFNNTEESVSHDPLIIDRTPFHISSTVSHNHFLLKFKSDDSMEKIFSWKFLYPLQLRDSTFDGYHSDNRESRSYLAGDWIVRVLPNITTPWVDRFYQVTFYDYDSRRVNDGTEYNTSLLEVNGEFDFPVQDDCYATFEQPNPDEIDVSTWKLKAVFDENDEKIFNGEDVLPDETDAHQWNMSLVKLKNGDFLFGIRKDADHDIDGKLFKIPKGGGEAEQVADGLKNFRLRELKNIEKAKK